MRILQEAKFWTLKPGGYPRFTTTPASRMTTTFFSFPVKARYHAEIIEGIGDPNGRGIEYEGEVEPPVVGFL